MDNWTADAKHNFVHIAKNYKYEGMKRHLKVSWKIWALSCFHLLSALLHSFLRALTE